MNKIYFVVIFIFFHSLLIVNFANAQYESTSVIKAQLLDTITQAPIEYATITIYAEGDKNALRYGVSTTNGYVEIARMEKGKFFVSIEHLGYYTVLKYISIEKERIVNLGKVLMKARSVDIDDIVVRGEAAIVQNGDTTEYNAKFFNPAPNDYLGDLLKKMPGLEFIGSNIYFKGVKVNDLTVEGRPFFMSDKSVALDNLPAYAVKKVKVFKRERGIISGIDDDTKKLQIDIVLNDEMKSGIIGNLTGGYGTESRYLAKGMLGRFGTRATTAFLVSANNSSRDAGNSSTFSFYGNGVAMPQLNNFRENSGDITTTLTGFDYATGSDLSNDLIYLNGAYKYNNSFITTLNKRETTLDDGILINKSDDILNNSSDEASVQFIRNKLLVVNKLKNKILRLNFLPSFNFKKTTLENIRNFSSQRVAEIENNNSGEALSVGDMQDIDARMQFNLINIKKEKKLFAFSSVNINLSYTNSTKDYINNSTTIFNDNDKQFLSNKREEHNDKFDSRILFYFSLPLNVSLKYEFKYKNDYSNIETFDYDIETNKYVSLNEDGSGNIKNNTLEQNIELSRAFIINRSKNKYFNISAMLVPIYSKTWNVRFADSYNKLNFIPLVSYTSKELKFKYTATIIHPTLNQIQPVINDDNPLYITMGNPNLRPEYSHILNFNSRLKFLNFIASGSLINNKIIYKQNVDLLGVTRIVPVNENGIYSSNVAVSFYRFPLVRNLSFSSTISGKYSGGKAYQNDKKYSFQNISLSGLLSFTYQNTFFDASIGGNAIYSDAKFSINTKERESVWTNNVFVNMNWALPYGFSLISSCNYTYYIGFKLDNTPSVVWNTEICKLLFNKRVVLSVKGYDILNQTKNLKITYADNYIDESTVNMIRRYILFSANFKFGKF